MKNTKMSQGSPGLFQIFITKFYIFLTNFTKIIDVTPCLLNSYQSKCNESAQPIQKSQNARCLFYRKPTNYLFKTQKSQSARCLSYRKPTNYLFKTQKSQSARCLSYRKPTNYLFKTQKLKPQSSRMHFIITNI